jgi:hypothetical protein
MVNYVHGEDLLELDFIHSCTNIMFVGPKCRLSAPLARQIKRYQSSTILLIDELGYLPFGKCGAELLFHVVTDRYERSRQTSLSKTCHASSQGDATMTSVSLRLFSASRSNDPHPRRRLFAHDAIFGPNSRPDRQHRILCLARETVKGCRI